jgi:GNAT superfamily N-acetyltransferase
MGRVIDGLELRTVAEQPELWRQMQELVDRVWPAFVIESSWPPGHPMPWDWMGIAKRWPAFQFGLFDPADGRMVVAGSMLALAWDGRAEELPDTGWNWAMVQGEQDWSAGLPAKTACALSVTVDPERRGRSLGRAAVRAMYWLARQAGLTRLLAPVRPSWKARYPLIPMAEYCRWTNPDGLPFDPWLRVHVRLGARIVKPCERSQPLSAPIEDWERWLDLPMPASGAYVAPGLLAPLQVDRDAGEGVCIEPNVWVEHTRLSV